MTGVIGILFSEVGVALVALIGAIGALWAARRSGKKAGRTEERLRIQDANRRARSEADRINDAVAGRPDDDNRKRLRERWARDA